MGEVEVPIDNAALFVPVGVYEDYPLGHWLQSNERIEDFANKGIHWFKLRNRQITLKVLPLDTSTTINVIFDPFWTVRVRH